MHSTQNQTTRVSHFWDTSTRSEHPKNCRRGHFYAPGNGVILPLLLSCSYPSKAEHSNENHKTTR